MRGQTIDGSFLWRLIFVSLYDVVEMKGVCVMAGELKLVDRLKAFFAAAPGSIQGYVNGKELMRVVFLALAAGGGANAILAAVRDSASVVVSNPQDVAWVSAVLVAIVEIQRRLKQGQELVDLKKSEENN